MGFNTYRFFLVIHDVTLLFVVVHDGILLPFNANRNQTTVLCCFDYYFCREI